MQTGRIGVFFDQVEKFNQVEANFKKYISDIEPSVKYLQKIQENNSKES